MNFSDQYLRPEWQKKRLEILERDKFTCCFCGDKESTLHVHHFYYLKDRKIWEYPSKSLKTLCDNCHEFYHATLIDLQATFSELLPRELTEFLSIPKEQLKANIKEIIKKKNEEEEIICPKCGFNCTHPIQVEIMNYKGKETIRIDETGIKTIYQTEPYGRGVIIKTYFSCEGGCFFSKVMKFHKGTTYVKYYESESSKLGTIWRD